MEGLRRAIHIVTCSAVSVVMGAALPVGGDELHRAGWREDFHSQPAGWELRTVARAKPAEFRVEPPTEEHDGALLMTAENASGMFATHLSGVDLHQTPILRWRWRAITLPTGADGRVPARDDQAIGIYVSSGGLLRQRSIAYRWETETPVGTEGEVSYAAGIVHAKWIAVRNAQDAAAGTFFTEERNVARDFQRAFGFVPTDVSIGVTCNSEYTDSTAVAELDWIELGAAPNGPDESETQ
jgi:hypothetical protein